MPTPDFTDTEFPQRIGKTARRVLGSSGYNTYAQLTSVTPKELLKIHGVGPKAIRILEEELQIRNLAFGS